MSTHSVQHKKSGFREIPSRRVLINDASQLPSDYSSTPGGTIFSTTPGGTRIIYDRAFLMQMRNSPVTRTPPKNLPDIPGVTSPSSGKVKPIQNETPPRTRASEKETGIQKSFSMNSIL
ncbi:eukaryotic translation initiation factor 4E-binding protein 1-like [Limulus polyphemus]|uniref:Eukaryotic translation initiation factor 4E-binding protein 1-like n=1 Tax=Limulus polyphemus TaxID=6850 RepID=A0ABM1BD33_LIMPO|nr:eukaryotic translation initiation factor 4E-binding protein 1-like [Limulus polyphemus]